MLLTALREEVWQANLELVRRGLAIFTFGNASGISRKDGLVAINPSGVPAAENANVECRCNPCGPSSVEPIGPIPMVAACAV